MSDRQILPLGNAAAVHRLPAPLLTRAIRVLVVGCGGTGSEIASGLPYLHQALLAYGHPAGLDVVLMDGDVVSPSNRVRQPFAESDIGHPKATILVNRINAFWGLRWRAIARNLTVGGRPLCADFVIGCVDSRKARATIWRRAQVRQQLWEHRYRGTRYWLDLGNNASSGQFVLGQIPRPAHAHAGVRRLPTVAELYPETVNAALDRDDTRPSCSAEEALTRQEPFVNRTLAAHALGMLARLFRYGELAYHGGFVNLETGRMTPMPVSSEHWARLTRADGIAA